MKHYAKIKGLFDWVCGVVSIASLAVSLRVSNTTKEIVREVEHYHETVVEHPSVTEVKYLHDTVYIKGPEVVTIVQRDTVYFPLIYNSDTGKTTVLSKEEINGIYKDRENFLKMVEQMKAQRNK